MPVGPRAGVGLPANIPKGPKAGRFKDKDRVEPTSSGGLDYGGEGGSTSRSGSDSPVKSEKRSVKKEKDYEDGRSDEGNREKTRSKVKSTRKKEEDREGRMGRSARVSGQVVGRVSWTRGVGRGER